MTSPEMFKSSAEVYCFD